MKYLKLFEEMSITEKEFPYGSGHNLSTREMKILNDLVGHYLNHFHIKVEDHYYYVRYNTIFHNRFDDFNELKDYILSCYYTYDVSYKPKEYLELYLELLKRSNLDPSFDRNWPIRWATSKGHTEIVKHLLSDSRVDPSAEDNYCIRRSWKIDIIELLLKDPRVDPGVEDNYLIRWANEYKQKEIVRLLLNDERVRSKLSEWEIKKYTNEIS